MPLIRRWYGWNDLRESATAMSMIAALTRVTRRALEVYASLSEEELADVLREMNTSGADLGHRFCYDGFFGGLAHVQWSFRSDEDFFLLSPMCAACPWPKPIDRVCLQGNGVMCTIAPEEVSAMYRVCLYNNSLRLHMRDAVPTMSRNAPTVCAFCLTHRDHFLRCTCGMVRYCDARCQRAHWRSGHKALCRWCIKCMVSFGPMAD